MAIQTLWHFLAKAGGDISRDLPETHRLECSWQAAVVACEENNLKKTRAVEVSKIQSLNAEEGTHLLVSVLWKPI